jgi:predicted phosphodiesterase
MKILILSDLHLEHGNSLSFPPGPAVDAYDAVVLAGDIHSPGHKAVFWARRESTFGGKPVLLVPGNHEFYLRLMPTELAEMKAAAAGSNVHLLDRESVVIDGVRFLGCTLWTDFQLPVRQSCGEFEADVGRAMAEANIRMNDFRLIEVLSPARSEHRVRERPRQLQASDALAMHWIDRDWLRRQLAQPFDGTTVVVSHHAPATGSVADRYAEDWMTPAYVSELPDEFFTAPALWVHGHTHTAFDYVRGRCRIVSNPRGYGLLNSSFENPAFNPVLVIDVGCNATRQCEGAP